MALAEVLKASLDRNLVKKQVTDLVASAETGIVSGIFKRLANMTKVAKESLQPKQSGVLVVMEAEQTPVTIQAVLAISPSKVGDPKALFTDLTNNLDKLAKELQQKVAPILKEGKTAIIQVEAKILGDGSTIKEEIVITDKAMLDAVRQKLTEAKQALLNLKAQIVEAFTQLKASLSKAIHDTDWVHVAAYALAFTAIVVGVGAVLYMVYRGRKAAIEGYLDIYAKYADNFDLDLGGLLLEQGSEFLNTYNAIVAVESALALEDAAKRMRLKERAEKLLKGAIYNPTVRQVKARATQKAGELKSKVAQKAGEVKAKAAQGVEKAKGWTAQNIQIARTTVKSLPIPVLALIGASIVGLVGVIGVAIWSLYSMFVYSSGDTELQEAVNEIVKSPAKLQQVAEDVVQTQITEKAAEKVAAVTGAKAEQTFLEQVVNTVVDFVTEHWTWVVAGVGIVGVVLLIASPFGRKMIAKLKKQLSRMTPAAVLTEKARGLVRKFSDFSTIFALKNRRR